MFYIPFHTLKYITTAGVYVFFGGDGGEAGERFKKLWLLISCCSDKPFNFSSDLLQLSKWTDYRAFHNRVIALHYMLYFTKEN